MTYELKQTIWKVYISKRRTFENFVAKPRIVYHALSDTGLRERTNMLKDCSASGHYYH